MRVLRVLVDAVLGLIVGAFLYVVAVSALPALEGRAAMLVVIAVSVLAVLYRYPGGALRTEAQDRRRALRDAQCPPRHTLDRLLATNVGRLEVSPLLVRGLMAWLAAALFLAILVPIAETAGLTLPGWAGWLVLGIAVAVFVAPALRKDLAAKGK